MRQYVNRGCQRGCPLRLTAECLAQANAEGRVQELQYTVIETQIEVASLRLVGDRFDHGSVWSGGSGQRDTVNQDTAARETVCQDGDRRRGRVVWIGERSG